MFSAKKIAETLCAAGAVGIRPDQPFVFGSGLISPIYLYFMTLLSDPERRGLLLKAHEAMIREKFSKFDTLATTFGTSTPWAVQQAERFRIPVVCIRKQRKQYAHKSFIEGVLKPGSKVLMVGSSVGSGKNVLAAAERIRKAGAELVGLAAIFNYELALSEQTLAKVGLRAETLTGLDTLLRAGGRLGQISPENETIIRDWQQEPVNWHRRQTTADRPLHLTS